MSSTNHEPRPESVPPFSEWSWILTLFGTAVGAGILYLPLEVGSTGLWALILLLVLVFPLIYFSHKSILALLLAERENLDYSGVVVRHFGHRFGYGAAAIYFVTFYAVLFSYSIGLNANLGDFLFQMGATSTNWAKGPALSFLILAALALLHTIGDKIVLRTMTAISFALIVVLFGISIYLIPFWDLSVFHREFSGLVFTDDILLILPILTFSFVFFPAMSSMVAAYRKSTESSTGDAQRRLGRTLMKTTILLMIFVLFFVFSCLLSLAPEEFERAEAENLNCLAILSCKAEIPATLADIAPLVGLAALLTSFVGVFFAVRESAHQIVRQILSRIARHSAWAAQCLERRKKIDACILFFLFSSLWILTLANPSVMELFGLLITPLVGIFLFILPVAILIKTNGFTILKKPIHAVVLISGIFILFSYKIGLWLWVRLYPQ